MLSKLGNVFNCFANAVSDGADLFIGGLAGTAIYSAFTHAASGREMAGAAMLTAAMAVTVGSRILGNKHTREAQEILRDKPETRGERSPASRPGPSGIIGGVG